jgi:hypothetical protein
MLKNALLLMLLATGVALADVSVGFAIGPPPPPRVLVQPVAPGPDFFWVDGYWYPAGRRYRWHNGYWTRPPYEGYRLDRPALRGRPLFRRLLGRRPRPDRTRSPLGPWPLSRLSGTPLAGGHGESRTPTRRLPA